MAEHEETTTAPAGHEHRDVTVRPVALAGVALATLIALAFVLTRALLGTLDARPGTEAPPLAAEYARTAPPEPWLQTNPRDDLRRLRDTEDRQLQGYGWVDRQAGTVHIPIERAMALLAERGR